MSFYENDDENTLRGLTICIVGAIIIIATIGFYCHLNDLHDEKMVQMGCNEKLINNSRLWECGKDKP